MATYEVKSNGPQGWQILEVCETPEQAYDSLARADRSGMHYELRLRKEFLDFRTGQIRGATISRAGRKLREEAAREEKRLEKEALQEQVQKRFHKKILAKWAKQEAMARQRLRLQTHPLYVAFLTSVLFLTGLGAVYYFEIVLVQ